MPRTPAANRAIKERQRTNLLAAARRLFVRGGTVTMEALAREAGVSQGLAYRYFPSKDELFRALVREFLAEPQPAFLPPAESDDRSPRERIEQIVTFLLDRPRMNPEFYRLFFRLASEGSLSPAATRLARERYDRLRGRLRELVVAAQGAGELGDDDPDELVSAIIACIEGLRSRIAREMPGRSDFRVPSPAIILRLLGPRRRAAPAHLPRPPVRLGSGATSSGPRAEGRSQVVRASSSHTDLAAGSRRPAVGASARRGTAPVRRSEGRRGSR